MSWWFYFISNKTSNTMETYFFTSGTYHQSFIIIFFTILIVITSGADPNEPPRFCKWEIFRAKCPAGSVIIMEEVLYGRMQYGKCIERDFGYVGCSNDVLPIADAKCSGMRDCQIPVPDIDMDAISECPNDLNRYLQATYDCVPVLPATRTQCQMDGITRTRGRTGNIASITTNETGCGGTDHPWLVQGEPGQKINFTLMDFALFSRNTSKTSTFGAHCHVYVIFKELGGNDETSGRSVTICGGKQRIQHVYTSTTHKVEVRVLGRNRNFIVNYTVWGCPSISKSNGGWVEQRGNRAEMGCNDNSDTWRLTCNGTHWHGQKPNCSSSGSSGSQLIIGKISLPYVASVIIIVIVAVVIGLSILLVGLICLRRQKLGANQRNRHPTVAEIKDMVEESHYKATLKLSNPPPYYRSANADSPLENEYAYVEDFLPTPPPADGVPMNKMIASQQAQYPGSTANHYGALGLSSKQTPHSMLQGQNSGCERVPRHYFELDPDMATNGNGYSHHVFADGHNSRALPHSIPPPPSQMLKYPASQKIEKHF